MASGDERTSDSVDRQLAAEPTVGVPSDSDPRLARTLTRGPLPEPAGGTEREDAPAVPVATGTALLGNKLAHFSVLELLGEGGMGQVYRARDERLMREVALKVIHPRAAAQDSFRERLLREARAAAAVSHKHIASVHEVGEDGDRAFIAMELIEGKTLRQALGVKLPLEEVLRLALQIARGMARAHDKFVLHRDLKPENVMVTLDGDVKILDFGLAKRMGAADDPAPASSSEDLGATQGGVIMGTPGYMAPEQILGAELDPRTDIFSFGAMLYEMVTGAMPFGGSGHQRLSATLQRVPTPPSKLTARVPAALEHLIMRCLARRREDRVASMHEVARELSQLAAGTFGTGAGWPYAEPTLDGPIAIRTRPLPSGCVTLLTAVAAEAALLVEHHGDAYPDILRAYHALVARVIDHHGGAVVSAAAEQVLSVFAGPRQALDAALEVQRAARDEAWPGGAAVRLRLGAHTGEPRLVGDRYAGLDVHRAVRIAESAPSGQVVLSAATREGLGDRGLDGLALRDLGSIRIKDLHYPEHLFALSLDGQQTTRSVVRSILHGKSSLPEQPTAFIGRTKLIAEIVALMERDDVRLVTLTGPGGTGKTRLSIEVARALDAKLPGGAVQVQLGAVTDPNLVLPTIARALDLPEVPGTPPLEVLANGIGASALLLVLDNFEQVVEAAPAVGGLLAACSGLKALVTSRELLQVRGEREQAVPPLELPAADGGFEDIAASEAVHLFAERARDSLPSFALTPANAPLVAAICARLDAIPLAIELAASRIKMLSLPALHRRLDDRLGFLKAAERDREHRHRTLRAAIDWSHDLLDEPYKILFRRVSVFRGGFSLESAEEVCGAAQGELDLDAFEGLSSLVSKSLLTLSEVDGARRLGALETIREYAQERLRQSPDEALVRKRHAEHFAAFVEETASGALGRDWRRHVGPLLTEIDNIRAALDWALAQPSAALTARMLKALQWFWLSYGRFTEGNGFVDRALEQTAGHGPTEERAVVLEAATWLRLLSGDIPAVMAHSAEGVAAWKALGREGEGARTQAVAGFITALTGAFPEGMATVRGACETCRARGDRYGVALALNLLAELARASGDYDEALALNEEMMGLLRGMGYVIQSSLFAINLAWCYLQKGSFSRAAEAVVETLELGQQMNNAYNLAYYLAVMASVAVLREKHTEGMRLFGAFDTTLRSTSATPQPADQAEISRYTEMAAAALGAEATAAARAEGAAWTRSQALAMAQQMRR